MQNGDVGILNVGAGDVRISFTSKDREKAARIVKDMLDRGYAIFVEVERNGVKVFERATGFDARRRHYILRPPDRRRGPRSKRQPETVPAATTRAVAVSRSAGG